MKLSLFFSLLVVLPQLAFSTELDETIWYFDSLLAKHTISITNEQTMVPFMQNLVYYEQDSRISSLVARLISPSASTYSCETCTFSFVGSFFPELRKESILQASQIFRGENSAIKQAYLKNGDALKNVSLAQSPHYYSYVFETYLRLIIGTARKDSSDEKFNYKFMEYLTDQAVEFLLQLNVDQTLLEKAIVDNHTVSTENFPLIRTLAKKYFFNRYGLGAKAKFDSLVYEKAKGDFDLKQAGVGVPRPFQIQDFEWGLDNPKLIHFLAKNARDIFINEYEILIFIKLAFASQDESLVSLATKRLTELIVTTTPEQTMANPGMREEFQHMNYLPIQQDHRAKAVTFIYEALTQKDTSIEARKKNLFVTFCRQVATNRRFAAIPEKILKVMGLSYSEVQPLVEFYAISGINSYPEIGKNIMVAMKGEDYWQSHVHKLENEEIENLKVATAFGDENSKLQYLTITNLWKHLNNPDLDQLLKKMSFETNLVEHLRGPFYWSLLFLKDPIVREKARNKLETLLMYDQEYRPRTELDRFQALIGYWSSAEVQRGIADVFSSPEQKAHRQRTLQIFSELGFSNERIQILLDESVARRVDVSSFAEFWLKMQLPSLTPPITHLRLSKYLGINFINSTLNYKLSQMSNSSESLNAQIHNYHENFYIADTLGRYVDPQLFLDGMSRFTQMQGSLFSWIYTVAFGNNSSQLKAAILEDIGLKIQGKDEVFNQFHSKGLNSDKDRFKYLFFYFCQPAQLPNFGEWVTDLFLRLEGNHQAVMDGLAEIQKEYSGVFCGKFAEDVLYKYRRWRPEIPNLKTDDSRKEYIYVNGGYSKYTNYTNNENDLQAFHHGLFHSKTHLLNANGPNSTVTVADSGTYTLNEIENFDLLTKAGIDLDVKPATMEVFENTIKEVAAANPAKVSLVFGGHGSPPILALWDRDLSARDLRSVNKVFSPETVVQSVFLQCYGGSMLASIYRLPPQELENSHSYFDNYYPANRCGLATSMHDELGEYYTRGKIEDAQDWTKSPWLKVFNWYYNPTLVDIRNYLYADVFVHVTPVLTSDYFVEDVMTTLCRQRLNGSSPLINAANSQMNLNEACNEQAKKRFNEITIEMKSKQDLANRLRLLTIAWTRELIRKEFPDVAKTFEEKMGSGWLQLEKYLNKVGQVELSMEEFRKYRPVVYSEGSEEYERLLASLPLISKYKPFFDDKMLEFAKQNPEQFKDIPNVHTNENEPPQATPNTIVSAVHLTVYQQAIFKAGERKGQANGLFENRKIFAERLFTLPEFKYFQDRYLNIKKCEETPLN